MKKLFLNDVHRNHVRMDRDETMTFSLEKTSDQIKPFVVDEDFSAMMMMMTDVNFQNDDDGYEDHQMDSYQNLN